MSVFAESQSFSPEGIPLGSDPFRTDWTIGVFLLMIALLSWVRAAYPFRTRLILDCLRAPRIVRQKVRNEDVLAHPASWILLIISILSGGLFFYQHHLFYGFPFLQGQGFGTFGICLLIVLSAFLLKLGSLSVLRTLLGVDAGIREYRFHLLLVMELLGIVLLPVTLLIAFMGTFPPEWGFFMTYPLMGLAFLLLFFRAIWIGKGSSVPPFYIFLYLCTLEILPLIVMIKAFIDQY